MPDLRRDEDLLAAFQSGDDAAGDVLFGRYYSRLVELVRRRMGWRVARAEDSSDVAQSVLRSVFRRSRGDATIQPDASGSLWPLLVTIAVNKLCNRDKFWQRQRRDARREVPLDDGLAASPQSPTPVDIASTQDLIEQLLQAFPPRRKRILELLLEGRTTCDVAELVHVSERTVYTTRRAAGELLRQFLADD